jgi:hypothetical protein
MVELTVATFEFNVIILEVLVQSFRALISTIDAMNSAAAGSSTRVILAPTNFLVN